MDFVVTGPSGSGKSTLVQEIMRRVRGLHLACSYTTRTQKPGEINGVHYHFVSELTFVQMIANKEFEEHARVHGNLYGTPKSELNHENVVFEIDCQGAHEIKKKRPHARRIFILASRDELERRLKHRNRDSDEEVAKRLSDAVDEVARANEFDCWLVNENFEDTVRQLEKIFLFFLLSRGPVSIPSCYRNTKTLERISSTFFAQPA